MKTQRRKVSCLKSHSTAGGHLGKGLQLPRVGKEKKFDFFCVAPETELGTYGKNYKEVDFYLNIKKNFLVN